MHSRAAHDSLPALKRRPPPQPNAQSADFPSASNKSASSPLRDSLSGAARTSSFGQPWDASAPLAREQQQQQKHQLLYGGHAGESGPSRRLRNTLPTPSSSPPLLQSTPAAASLSGLHTNDTSQRIRHLSTEAKGRDDVERSASVDRATPDVRGSGLADSSGERGGERGAAEAGASLANNVNATLRAERLRELDAYVLQRAGRHATMAERQKAVQKSLSLLPTLYPQLSGILDSVQRYTDDVAAQVRRAEEDKAEALRQQEQRLYAEFETFFEGKIKELVAARQKAEARAEAEHAAAFAVRQERDTELVEVKEELLQRLNECEHTEEQFRDFRHLIASVFQTNQQLTLRIDQLESVLTRHRIEIPPANAELSAYKTSEEAKGGGDGRGGGGGGGGGGDGRALSSQVSVEFMAAANKELVKSRLTLQQELLHSAFDDHSAYRLRIEGLTRQNQDLAFHITELEEKVKELYTYIHQKRFITRVDEYGRETTPLTPRPREVPLALQTELGIELRHSTANILTELSTVALNMKHQLNSALLRARQLHALSTWLNEADTVGDAATSSTPAATAAGVVAAVLRGVTEAAVIPVFPVASWPTIPHFLRTNVSPEVRNCAWTEAQAGCIFYNFFASYKVVRARSRFVRDAKMLAPRTHQLYEHRRVLLTRLDATKDDVARSEENVPFGYVVSQFAREVLTQLSPQNAQDALPLVLPGTITTRYPLNPPGRATMEARRTAAAAAASAGTGVPGSGGFRTPKATKGAPAAKTYGDNLRVEDCEWVDAAPVVELDWTRFTYNMWYAALRYQATQPLCQLFTDLVDGRLPLETFDVMEQVLARVQRLADQLDSDRSRRFAYPRLANGVVRWVNDTGAQSVLSGVRAVVQVFESHGTTLHGGTLTPLDLFADETYCDREEALATLSAEAAVRHQRNSFVPANGTATAKAAVTRDGLRTPLPGTLTVRQLPPPTLANTASPALTRPPLGATVFVRYWRTFVRETLLAMYTRIEAVLTPLVEESEVVMGLYLLSLPRATAALAELDKLERQAALRAAVFGGAGGGLHGGAFAFGFGGQSPEETLTGAKLVAEAADLLGVHGVARSFLTLLEARKGALQEKKMAERHVATETVRRAAEPLPRFKYSTHFPFRLQQEETAAAALRAEEAAAEVEEAELSAANTMKSPLTPSSFAITNEAAFAKEKKNTGGRKGKNGGKSPRKALKKSKRAPGAASIEGTGDPLSNGAEQSDSRLLLGSQKKKADSHKAAPKPLSSSNGLGSPKSQDLASGATKVTETENLIFAGDLMSSSMEGELIEWYSLRHALRQIMPDFPFLLFQPDAFERAEEAEALAKLPVLKAFEESLPTVVEEGETY